MITLGDFCEGVGLPRTAVGDLMEVLKQRELVELAAHEARMHQAAGRPAHEVLPLTDEGDVWGQVEARIPKTLAWNLIARKGFGWEGLVSDEGIKDILRDNPACRVKTVSGRTVVGWTPGRRIVKKYQ